MINGIQIHFESIVMTEGQAVHSQHPETINSPKYTNTYPLQVILIKWEWLCSTSLNKSMQ